MMREKFNPMDSQLYLLNEDILTYLCVCSWRSLLQTRWEDDLRPRPRKIEQ